MFRASNSLFSLLYTHTKKSSPCAKWLSKLGIPTASLPGAGFLTTRFHPEGSSRWRLPRAYSACTVASSRSLGWRPRARSPGWDGDRPGTKKSSPAAPSTGRCCSWGWCCCPASRRQLSLPGSQLPQLQTQFLSSQETLTRLGRDKTYLLLTPKSC